MEFESAGAAEPGEARRHLQTLLRRRWYVVIPVLLGIVAAFALSRGGEDTFVARADVRVPSGQASVFDAGSSLTSTEAERVIASAIQLIRSSNVRDEVQAAISQEAFDQITLFDVSSVSDTFFVRITVGSLDPAIARSAARAYADEYIVRQGQLDVADLRTRADQLINSAVASEADVDSIDVELAQIDEEIVRLDFEIRALEATLAEGIVPDDLVDKTILRNDLQRQRDVKLSDRSRESAEVSFLRQEASNLRIEESYRTQTGAQLVAAPEAATLLSGRSLRRDIVVFVLLGGMVGVGLALLREYFDSKIRSPSDLHDLAPEIPIVGAIPKMRNAFNQPHLAMASGRPWFAAEAYRALRTTILATKGRTHRTFAISSVGANAGKSVTITNLATSLAQAGHKTLVIDANLRRPSVHMKLRVRNDQGLSYHLETRVAPEHLVVSSELAAGLAVLPSGPIPHNPAELVGSPAMAALLEWAEANYDYVLVDTPPLDVFTDAAVVGHQVGGVLLVVRFEATDHRRLAETLDQMSTAGVPIWGFVVNGRQESMSRATRYARRVGARNLKTMWTDRPGSTAVGSGPSPGLGSEGGRHGTDLPVPASVHQTTPGAADPNGRLPTPAADVPVRAYPPDHATAPPSAPGAVAPVTPVPHTIPELDEESLQSGQLLRALQDRATAGSEPNG